MAPRQFVAGIGLALIGSAAALPTGPADVTSRGRQDAATTRAAKDSVLWIEMRNVDMHVDEVHVMHMRSLRGQVIAKAPGNIAWLDDPKSFHIRVTSGVVALNGDAIAALLNATTFNYPGAPVKHLRIRIEKGQLVQRGTLHKGVDIPFEMWSTPMLERDGRLRLHPDKLRIFSVNGVTLMRALGLHLDKLMDLTGAKGASVKGDDLYIEPLQLIPPPTVDGRLSAVRIEDTLLVQEFARTAGDSVFGSYVRPDSGSHNFVYFRGGLLRFGKLTMTDTDLLIGDDDESDPLDLYMTQYNRQLVAGRTKNLPNLGLRTWLVDYHRLGAAVTATRH